MSLETVSADNGTETKNGRFNFDAGQDEITLFDFGANSGIYFKPKGVTFGLKLTAEKVQSAFIKDNSNLPKNPYVLGYQEPRAGSKGRGLIVYKNYTNGPRKQYGIVNHWDSNIKLDMGQVSRIVELANHSVNQAMSDTDLANDS